MKENGLLTIVDPGADKPIDEIPTMQCVHCGGHFQVVAGSGRLRGWCALCHGPTCGPGCLVGTACVPNEQLLENMEAGRPYNYRPIVSRGS